jgi:TRAP-type C4-dicarboxylate transport system permease large subunit
MNEEKLRKLIKIQINKATIKLIIFYFIIIGMFYLNENTVEALTIAAYIFPFFIAVFAVLTTFIKNILLEVLVEE